MDIIVVLIIVMIICWLFNKNNTEHMTNDNIEHMSDEAVQNLSSLSKMYDTGAMAVKDVKLTGGLVLGDKFRLSGTGDKFGNDEWLRLMNKDNTDQYGGLAANKLWTAELTLAGPVKGNVAATGEVQTGVIRGTDRLHLTGPKDAFMMFPSGVHVTRDWGGNGNLNVQGTLQADNIVTNSVRIGNFVMRISPRADWPNHLIITNNGENKNGIVLAPDGRFHEYHGDGRPHRVQID
jgi:hypothetical protein